MILGDLLKASSRWVSLGLLAAVVGLGVHSCQARDAQIAQRARMQQRLVDDSLQMLGLRQQLDAARDSLAQRSKVTERVIEHWHETETRVPVPIIVRDSTGSPVVDSVGTPQYAVPLPAYTELQARGDSLASTCNALLHDCDQFRLYADSVINAQARTIHALSIAPPAPSRSWGWRLLEDVTSASVGYAACRLTR